MPKGVYQRLPKSLETREKIRSVYKGRFQENSNRWSGEKVGRTGLHYRIYRVYGRAKKCELRVLKRGVCKCKSESYDWANISGEYKHDIMDFIQLCRSCHERFDKKAILSLEEMKLIRGSIFYRRVI